MTMSSSEKFNPQAGPETVPFDQPVTIFNESYQDWYDSWSGNPPEPTDEERAESERDHARLMAATHEAVNKMVQDFDDLTNEDRYRRVKEFILVRRKQWYDQVQNNCATEGG